MSAKDVILAAGLEHPADCSRTVSTSCGPVMNTDSLSKGASLPSRRLCREDGNHVDTSSLHWSVSTNFFEALAPEHLTRSEHVAGAVGRQGGGRGQQDQRPEDRHAQPSGPAERRRPERRRRLRLDHSLRQGRQRGRRQL